MDAMNLKYIKELLIKIDDCSYKEKRVWKELAENTIKENIENYCNKIVEDIKINRDGCYGFTAHVINKDTNKNEYIKFTFISHNQSCRIVYEGKFEINIRL